MLHSIKSWVFNSWIYVCMQIVQPHEQILLTHINAGQQLARTIYTPSVCVLNLITQHFLTYCLSLLALVLCCAPDYAHTLCEGWIKTFALLCWLWYDIVCCGHPKDYMSSKCAEKLLPFVYYMSNIRKAAFRVYVLMHGMPLFAQ